MFWGHDRGPTGRARRPSREGVIVGRFDASLDRRADASLRWRVLDGPWAWRPTLRILFVLDGRISTSDNPMAFGLGLVLDTLSDDSFAWWVRYQVDVVRRDDGGKRLAPPLDRYPERLNFRFTEP